MATDVGDKTYLSHTAQDIDDGLDAIPLKALQSDLVAETAARQVLQTALIAQINGGAKNRCPTQSGSSAGQSEVRWFDISGLSVPAGDYVFSFTSMTSTDTDGSRCRGVFYDENGGRASEYFYIPRGDNVSVNVILTAAAKSCRINSGETLAESTGDTMSFSGAMICSKADWAVSQAYAPYCPTLPELYQMIISQNGGTPLMMMGAPHHESAGDA